MSLPFQCSFHVSSVRLRSTFRRRIHVYNCVELAVWISLASDSIVRQRKRWRREGIGEKLREWWHPGRPREGHLGASPLFYLQFWGVFVYHFHGKNIINFSGVPVTRNPKDRQAEHHNHTASFELDWVTSHKHGLVQNGGLQSFQDRFLNIAGTSEAETSVTGKVEC